MCNCFYFNNINVVTVYTALKFSYFTKEKVFGGSHEMAEQVRDLGVQTWGPEFKCLPFHSLWLSPCPGGTTTEIKNTQMVIKLFFWKQSPNGWSTPLLWKSLSAVCSSDTERTRHDSVYHWSSTELEILPQNTWDVVGTRSWCVWKAFWSFFLLSHSTCVWKNNATPPLLFLAIWHNSVLTSIREVDWTIQNPTPAHLGCRDNSEQNRCLLRPRCKCLEKFRYLASALIDS